MRTRTREGHRWAWAVGLSVGGHLLLSALLLLVALLPSPRPLPKPQAVSLRAIDAHQWELNRGPFRPSSSFAPKRAPAPEEIPTGQVVDVAPGNNQVAPDAKYLAETNNRVSKQTRALVQTANYGRAAPKTHASTQAKAQAQEKTGGRSAQAVSAVGQLDRLLGTGGFRPRPSQYGLPSPPGSGETDSPDATGAKDGQDEQTRSGADIPSDQVGGGAPNDDLNDLEAGDGTFLDTREWKYAGFFNRMKQAISAHWDPGGTLREKDPRGTKWGGRDRITVLVIALRPDGSLADDFVAKSCGLDFLDRAAMDAVEKAQPFPNPPLALVRNGLIRFNFGFTLTNDYGMPGIFQIRR